MDSSESEDNNWKEFYIQISKLTIINHNNYHISNIWILKVLNNIKLELLNPSNRHIIHKKHLLYHHKVCAHEWQSMCTSTPNFCTYRHMPNNTLKKQGTFMGTWRYHVHSKSVIPATFYYKNAKSQRNNMVIFVKSQRNNSKNLGESY